MKAAQTLKQPYVLNLSTQTPMTLMTSVTDFFFFFYPPADIFLNALHYITGKISGSLAHSNSPSDHYFSGLHCKAHARCIAKTNNKVDSSHAG